MTLGNQDDPVIVKWKEEGKVQGESWIKYNEVGANIDHGHIPEDLA